MRAKPLVWIGVALVTVAGVAVAGVALGGRYADSPERSLESLAAAVRAEDWDGVQTYFDAEAVGSAFAKAAIASAMSTADGTEEDASSAHDDSRGSEATGEGATSRMEATFTDNFVEPLQSAVESGIPEGSGGLAGVLLAGSAKKVTYVNDSEAEVTVVVPADEDATEEVLLTMVRADDHWQIIELTQISDLTLPAK
jgi:hypothetical protein